MNANELRIGNYLQRMDGSWLQVTAEDILSISKWKASDALLPKPIPLTEEWLLKFGFVQRKEDWAKAFFNLNNEEIILKEGESPKWIRDNEGYVLEIPYVHQLQNLYFALTGQELQLTPPTP
jgi:hypothetical protein